QPASGWRAGDKLVLPDTRQLDYSQRGPGYASQEENPTIAAIAADGLTLTLAAPLKFDHFGAHDALGDLQFLPHAADLTRNITLRSQSATGTRGQALFTYRADVDVRYAAFVGLGRTRLGDMDDTTLDPGGAVSHLGT